MLNSVVPYFAPQETEHKDEDEDEFEHKLLTVFLS